MTKLDKDRLGFRPEKGQNHWSRNCQNSGTKKRQPTLHENEIDLIKNGYTLNPETKNYEKKVKINNKEVILRTVKIPSENKNIVLLCDRIEGLVKRNITMYTLLCFNYFFESCQKLILFEFFPI
jgi:hypothetical protein